MLKPYCLALFIKLSGEKNAASIAIDFVESETAVSAPPIIPAIAIAPDSSRIVSVSLVISLTSLPITSRDSLLTEKPTEIGKLRVSLSNT